jgi:hypothetical protein
MTMAVTRACGELLPWWQLALKLYHSKTLSPRSFSATTGY